MKNILNDFKGKVLEEVQSLIKEMRYISCNDSKESSALLTRTNSANDYVPFYMLIQILAFRECIKFRSALNFLKLIKSKASNFGY